MATPPMTSASVTAPAANNSTSGTTTAITNNAAPMASTAKTLCSAFTRTRGRVSPLIETDRPSCDRSTSAVSMAAAVSRASTVNTAAANSSHNHQRRRLGAATGTAAAGGGPKAWMSSAVIMRFPRWTGRAP